MPAMSLPDGVADFGNISKSIAPVGWIAACRIKIEVIGEISINGRNLLLQRVGFLATARNDKKNIRSAT